MDTDIKANKIVCNSIQIGNDKTHILAKGGVRSVGLWLVKDSKTKLAINQVDDKYTSIEFYNEKQRLDFAIGITAGEATIQFGMQLIPISKLKELLTTPLVGC